MSSSRKAAVYIAIAVGTACLMQEARAEGMSSQVSFNEEGLALVDGKPFFPIGVFTYEINPAVLDELHKVRCNTVLHGFRPDQLGLLHEHRLMAVAESSDEWVAGAVNQPSLLAWYLTDEPENRGLTREAEIANYRALKSKDSKHPIGLCHTSFEALTTFKDACDFTMTDIYPITPKRDKNILGVSIMMDEARRIHRANWPKWTCIQTFGGPEADNGIWAVPTPREVRLMTYLALVHRATGILYFSYWPQATETWRSLVPLNAEVDALVPRLVADGNEEAMYADDASVQGRVRVGKSGSWGVMIAVNTTPKELATTIRSGSLPAEVSATFENRQATVSADHALVEQFGPYGVHVYTWGAPPAVTLAEFQRR